MKDLHLTWTPLIVAPRGIWQGLSALDRDLASLLEILVHEARGIVSGLHSLSLYGGIALGEFSRGFSDINLTAFSSEPMTSENTAMSLRLWSQLVQAYPGLARRLVINFTPVPGIGNDTDDDAEMTPTGFQIRTQWADGRVLCRALWDSPLSEMDLTSLTRVGCCLLGHPPGEFLNAPVFHEAILREGRRLVEHLFIKPEGRRYRRAFIRAKQATRDEQVSWLDTKRILSATLGLTRLYQSIEEGRLVPHSISGFWFHHRGGGPAGKFARDAAIFRLKPEVYPTGYLISRARHFPALGRTILERIAPILYKDSSLLKSSNYSNSPNITPNETYVSKADVSRAKTWDDLTRVVTMYASA